MSGLHHALERLRAAIDKVPKAARGHESLRVTVSARDLAELLRDHQDMDAALRAAHVRDNPKAYPPRYEMLARAASDPGAFAGYKGERSMGAWIADAIMAMERREARESLLHRAQVIAGEVTWGDVHTDATAKRYYDTAVERIMAALAAPHPAQVALRDLIDMVDRLDRHPSRGGGVLPMDKAKVMHAAREAAE